MTRTALAILLSLIATAALAATPVWQRERDDRYEVATAAVGPGTTLGFFCQAYQVPNTAIISLHNLILSTQLPDGKKLDLRFVIDGEKYDLPGIAKDGELLVSPADANMELLVRHGDLRLLAGQGPAHQTAARRRGLERKFGVPGPGRQAGADRRAGQGLALQTSARRRG